MADSEPTITCPQCHGRIKLTESLAAPLIDSTRAQYERKLQQQASEIEAQLKQERQRIAAEEAQKAKLLIGSELETKSKAVEELQEVIRQRDEKLAEAQKAQAEARRKERELEDAKREIDLTIETRVAEALAKTREQAKREIETELLLKVQEKDELILSMQKRIEELRKKSEQASEQLQGEALELHLESLLANRFPHDMIAPVPKGDHGGDILHRVITPTGVACGTILWEAKRTRNWNDNWLPKLRDDQRAAKAELAAIVSCALPKGVDTFDEIDGVWVIHPRAFLPVALALRSRLIEVNCARQSSEGQHTKTELIYQYLTGPRFKHRVQAIVEAFTCMSDDLQKERKAITRQWAKREEQINRVVEATAGMYGDLQGIAGKSLQEIEGLTLGEDEIFKALPGE